MSLTVREQMALEIEARRWKWMAAKHTAVREQLGWTPTRHAQVVNALLERPDALAAYPVLVQRLRRLREARQYARSARRTGWNLAG